MADLSPQQVQDAVAQAQAGLQLVTQNAQALGLQPKTGDNDWSKIAQAAIASAGGGAGAGASIGLAIAPALGPFAPIAPAIGAAVGAIGAAIVGFFSAVSFHHKPTEAEIALAHEWDKLNSTIAQGLGLLPADAREMIAGILYGAMAASPGPLPFCFNYMENGVPKPIYSKGCVMTTIDGVRAASTALTDQVAKWTTETKAKVAVPAPAPQGAGATAPTAADPTMPLWQKLGIAVAIGGGLWYATRGRST